MQSCPAPYAVPIGCSQGHATKNPWQALVTWGHLHQDKWSCPAPYRAKIIGMAWPSRSCHAGTVQNFSYHAVLCTVLTGHTITRQIIVQSKSQLQSASCWLLQLYIQIGWTKSAAGAIAATRGTSNNYKIKLNSRVQFVCVVIRIEWFRVHSVA